MTKTNTTQNRKPKIFYGYIIVVATFFILIAMVGTVLTFGVFITPIMKDLGWKNAVLSGAFSVSFLISGFLGIATGKLSDKYGPRRIILICSLFFAAGFILMSQVNAIWQLYLIYGGFIAIGKSSAIAPLQSTIVRWFVKKRGLIVAIFLMGITGGSMIMPPVANRLIMNYGWRTAYIILGISAFVIIFLAALFLKRSPSQIGESAYGSEEIGDESTEPHSAQGATLKEALHNTQFWLLCALFFCLAFAMLTIMTHIVPHAINEGISATTAATIMAIIGAVSTAAMIPEGIIADRIGVTKTAIIFTFLLVISMLWISLTGQSIWSLLLFAAFFGVALSSMDILLTLLSSSLFGLAAIGTIIGFFNAILQLGGAIGPFVAGLIYDSRGHYYPAFILCTIISLVALVISFLLQPVKHSQH